MLLRDCFNSFNLYTNDKLSRNQIGRSTVQVKEENETFTVVCSRSPQNVEIGHFTLLFCRERQRNVSKCKTHVQSDCCVFWRCRRRRRGVFVRSLLSPRKRNECKNTRFNLQTFTITQSVILKRLSLYYLYALPKAFTLGAIFESLRFLCFFL